MLHGNKPKLIYIIGVARTGSQMIRYILNHWTPVHICDEIHYILPPWLPRKDAKSYIDSIKKKDGSAVDNLLKLFYSGKLYGNFWKDELPKIDRKILENLLNKCEVLDDRCILKSLIIANALSNNKQIAGAKFPVNIIYANKIIEWFPESKVIHLVRDPRAIYASMVKKDMKNKGVKGGIKMAVIYVYRFVYLIQQYKSAAKFHKKYNHHPNYLLIRYEDILLQPENTLKKLCNFIGVHFVKEMINPPVIDSSYKSQKSIGLDKSALYRWKNRAPPIVFKLLSLLLRREMNLFGYI